MPQAGNPPYISAPESILPREKFFATETPVKWHHGTSVRQDRELAVTCPSLTGTGIV